MAIEFHEGQQGQSGNSATIEKRLGRLEGELRAQQRQLEEVHDFLNIATEFIFFKGVDLRYTRVNRSAAALFGHYNTGQAVGTTAADYFAPATVARQEAQERRILATGIPVFDEAVEVELLDGRRRWLQETKHALFGPNGQVDGLAIISRDITRQRREAEQRRQLDSLLEHLQWQDCAGILAGAVGHDINNYLLAIRVNAEFLQRSLADNEAGTAYLQRIDHAAQHAGELARHLLNSGREEWSPESVRLDKLVGDLLKVLSVSLPRHVKVRFQSSADPPPVYGDSAQLRQVVMNLILNAAQAISGQEGSITIEAGHTEQGSACLSDCACNYLTGPGPLAYVEISDSGRGMDAAELEHMLEPFYTTKTNGRGMGLAVVCSILKRHKGALKVWSRPGYGTTFRMLVPVLSFKKEDL